MYKPVHIPTISRELVFKVAFRFITKNINTNVKTRYLIAIFLQI